jgi:hypothetical protein
VACASRAILARKSKPVDVRPAKPGEVIVTMIKGEGKETQTPPAKSGDMVVRNRCPETGNEQFLVPAASFSERYEGPIGAPDADGWLPYRPRGVQMRSVVVTENDGSFNFVAPWGERMIARPGDAIVQDLNNPKDTYRIAKEFFRRLGSERFTLNTNLCPCADLLGAEKVRATNDEAATRNSISGPRARPGAPADQLRILRFCHGLDDQYARR